MTSPSPSDQSGQPPSTPRQFVTPLKSIQQQVGESVIHALQHEETMAVLTTVMAIGDGSQQIVSVGLDQSQMEKINELLRQSQEAACERVPCVGFHCFIKPKEKAGDDNP
jgi:hypothetical protein